MTNHMKIKRKVKGQPKPKPPFIKSITFNNDVKHKFQK